MLVIIGLCVVLLAALSLAVLLPSSDPNASAVTAVLPAAIGLVYAGAGLLAWHRRPHNRIGALLVGSGVAFVVWGLQRSHIEEVAALGLLLQSLPFAVVIHLVLAFPSGRVEDRAGKVVVCLAYLLIPLVDLPAELLGATRLDIDQPLDVAHDETAANIALLVQVITTAAMCAVTAILLVGRLRSGDPAWRRLAGPVYVGGIVAFALQLVLEGVGETGVTTRQDAVAVILNALGTGVLLILPVAILVSILRGGFARTGRLEELVINLSDAPSGDAALAGAIGDALGDPSASLVYWLEDEARYVDASGAPVTLPSGRRMEQVIHDGRRVGAIVYDSVLLRDIGPVRSVAGVVGFALERERLAAELRASARELEASRRRVAEAADVERRRIARDLHDGAQQRLVLLAIQSDQLRRRAGDEPAVRDGTTRLREGLDAALTDLRELVHGIMPPMLAERGLRAAAEELAADAPLPVTVDADPGDLDAPDHVQTAGYFVINEALVNVVKHAQASRAVVSLHRVDGSLRIEVADDGVGGADPAGGSGIRGLADRAAAVGGTLTLASARGSGTRVMVELPCAS